MAKTEDTFSENFPKTFGARYIAFWMEILYGYVQSHSFASGICKEKVGSLILLRSAKSIFPVIRQHPETPQLVRLAGFFIAYTSNSHK
ncbi:hypothetical protein [Burkholderia ubonensis]|uniref:hypothetical protein n=1 Tax=Burkholderia ubonensis TaxID=101571 RepID=UPI000AAC8F37|nr:hypothetical protein [Burkholderia ubonensis]